jgi:hypothetical protein
VLDGLKGNVRSRKLLVTGTVALAFLSSVIGIQFHRYAYAIASIAFIEIPRQLVNTELDFRSCGGKKGDQVGTMNPLWNGAFSRSSGPTLPPLISPASSPVRQALEKLTRRIKKCVNQSKQPSLC